MTKDDITKEKCPKCQSSLFPVVGDRSVLIICVNHKKGSTYKIKGNKTCDYQIVVDREQYYQKV